MPEGPELHATGLFINRVSDGRFYAGKVIKSEVSTKNPDIDWDVPSYTITASTRGKEIMLTLREFSEDTKPKLKKKVTDDSLEMPATKEMTILFRFGMSGKFTFTPEADRDKHAHLNFFSRDDDQVLSFNDYRRFGRWEVTDQWGKDRGPCIIEEYDLFRKAVLSSLEDSAFNKPICEVMLNQKYFNGVGNYLRAEVLHRLGIAPFQSARSVLEPIRAAEEAGVKQEDDVLKLCHDLPLEVLDLNNGQGHLYDKRGDKDGFASFLAWLRCYVQEGMTNLVDHNGRTIWFKGPAGPMAPKGSKTRSPKKRSKKATTVKEEEQEDEPATKKVTRTYIKKERAKATKVKEEKPAEAETVGRKTNKTKSNRSKYFKTNKGTKTAEQESEETSKKNNSRVQRSSGKRKTESSQRPVSQVEQERCEIQADEILPPEGGGLAV